MDPQDPQSFHHRTERLSTGQTYHFVDEKPTSFDPKTTPTLLLIHGFPDFWYGWRYQIAPWVNKGWRVVVPDTLGYGGSSKPDDVALYSVKNLCADLVALLDIIDVERAIIIGHDWGSVVAWRFCLYHPNRVRALVSLSVPFNPPAPVYIPLPEQAKRYPNFRYMLYFSNPVSTKQIEAELPGFFDRIYRSPKKWVLSKEDNAQVFGSGGSPKTQREGDLLNEQEFNYYTETFKDSMNGPLMYYKTVKLRFEEEKAAQLPSYLPSSLPVIFFNPKSDPTCSQKHVQGMTKFVPNLEVVDVENTGHWLMVEQKDVITNGVAQFVERVMAEENARTRSAKL
jgi:soluble epoxide hydrolase/lipid-phosphate phosphatase